MAKRPLSEIIKKTIIKNIDKDTYLDLKNPQKIDCIPVGSIVVQKVIGLEGVPRGRITEIFGAESSGKTTLVTSLAIECQKKGGHTGFLDFEQAFHLGYAKQQGLDVDDDATFGLFQPTTFEEGWTITRGLIEGGCDLIIIDSVSGMTPKKILNAEIDKDAQPGVMARMMSQYVAEVTKKINDSRTAFVFVNQIRSRIKMSMYDTGPDTDTSGGKALKFYASLRLELFKKSTETRDGKNSLDGTDEKIPVSNIVSCINRKNKLALPYRKADFVIRLGEGIDDVRSLCDIGVNLNLIKKETGGYYSPNAKRKIVWPADTDMREADGRIHGMEKLRNFYVKHDDAYENLVDNVFISQDASIAADAESEEEVVAAAVAGDVNIDAFVEEVGKKAVDEAKPKRGKMKKETKKQIQDIAEVSIDSIPLADSTPVTELKG